MYKKVGLTLSFHTWISKILLSCAIKSQATPHGNPFLTPSLKTISPSEVKSWRGISKDSFLGSCFRRTGDSAAWRMPHRSAAVNWCRLPVLFTTLQSHCGTAIAAVIILLINCNAWLFLKPNQPPSRWITSFSETRAFFAHRALFRDVERLQAAPTNGNYYSPIDFAMKPVITIIYVSQQNHSVIGNGLPVCGEGHLSSPPTMPHDGIVSDSLNRGRSFHSKHLIPWT